MNSFARDRGLGKWGEKHVIEHLTAKTGIKQVLDVSDIPRWQEQGVDIIVTDEDGTYTADIKMDRKIALTGNLFFETMSGIDVMGNLITSIANEFLYLDPGNCRLYTIDREMLKNYWLANQNDIEIKTVGNKDRMTQGFLMKVQEVIDKGFATVEDIYIEGARNNKVDAPERKESPLPF